MDHLASITAGLLVAVLLGHVASAAKPHAQSVPGSPYPEIPAEAVASCPTFPIRAYHQHLFPDRQPMEVFHKRLEELAACDYNMVVFGMGHPGASTITMHKDGSITPNGCDTEAMRGLVAHAIELGLEPVFEMKFIGKQIPLIKELLEDHPGLVIDPKNRATVLNAAYHMPDGQDAYSATALKLVQYLLDLYPANHPATYFHFGIDEFDADDMATLGKSLEMSPSQAFAYCLNIGADYVLARKVMPIIWGDILLSPALGTADHGITLPGYVPDPRHESSPAGAYHGSYKSGEISLHTMVNFLRDRDKIIVADWHYSPSSIGEFPSVDYFQGLGFKDVWGCPWYNATNLRQFSRYAASRGCGGMMATAWHMAYLPTQRLLLQHIIRNSSAYFHKPALTPPPPPPAAYSITDSQGRTVGNEKQTGIALRNDLVLSFSAPVPATVKPRDAILCVSPVSREAEPIEESLTCDPVTRELRATFTLPSNVPSNRVMALGYGYVDEASGYFDYRQCPQGLAVVDELPAHKDVPAGTLLAGDFAEFAAADSGTPVWLVGKCATLMGRASRKKPSGNPRAGGLDTEWFDRIWANPSDYLNRAITEGMTIDIEARMTRDFSGNEYCALLTKGSYSTGFRVLVREDRHLLFQFAGINDGAPLWLHSEAPLPMDSWVNIHLTYRPPKDGAAGEAAIRFDDTARGSVPIPVAMPVSGAVIGIGCEFTNPLTGPSGKRRPNFPGIIRSFRFSTPGPRL